MRKCKLCGKPTNSHDVGGGKVCHQCYIDNPDDVEELEREYKEFMSNSLLIPSIYGKFGNRLKTMYREMDVK